jgi:uncharacterized membrane protein
MKKGILESNILCPICGGNDKTRKVSTIIANEEKIASLLKMPKKPEMDDSTFDAPPPIPPVNKNIWWYVLLIGSSLCIMGTICEMISSFGYENSRSLGDIIFMLIVMLIVLAFLGLLAFLSIKKIRDPNLKFQEQKEEYSKQMVEHNRRIQEEAISKKQQYNNWLNKWEKAHDNHKKLYYCERDNVVFIPGYPKAAQISEIKNFIYTIDTD